jgi:hypothetical protein
MFMVHAARQWPTREGMRAIIGDAICVLHERNTEMSHRTHSIKICLADADPRARGAFAIGDIEARTLAFVRGRYRRQHDRPNWTFDAGSVMEDCIR